MRTYSVCCSCSWSCIHPPLKHTVSQNISYTPTYNSLWPWPNFWKVLMKGLRTFHKYVRGRVHACVCVCWQTLRPVSVSLCQTRMLATCWPLISFFFSPLPLYSSPSTLIYTIIKIHRKIPNPSTVAWIRHRSQYCKLVTNFSTDTAFRQAELALKGNLNVWHLIGCTTHLYHIGLKDFPVYLRQLSLMHTLNILPVAG